ncbi:MAG: sigma 54-interacting response regulator [Pedobacter sp.]|uniref:sigma 54-interacting transcriptional regulator n=1 Tax=Pedobacter sp. TaxID=1411316 RepID=UPI0033997DE9
MKKILIIEDESLVAHHIKLVLTAAGYRVCGIADTVEEARLIITEQRPNMVLLDINLKGSLNGIDLARELTKMGISFVYLTANFQGRLLEEAKATLPYGFIVKPFREDDLLTTLDVAFFRMQNMQDYLWQQESELEQKLKSVNDEVFSLDGRMLKAAIELQAYVPFDYLNIIVQEEQQQTACTGFLRIGFDEYQSFEKYTFIRVNRLDEEQVSRQYENFTPPGKAVVLNEDDFREYLKTDPIAATLAKLYNIYSALFISIPQSNGRVSLAFYSRKSITYRNQHITLLSRLQSRLSSLFNVQTDFAQHNGTGTLNKIPEKPEINKSKIAGIIAASPAMLSVMDLIATAAPLDISVLILGESGTGKEKVAKGIHLMSSRKDKPMVIVNCASLPANLVESELFGHEKGAFTGATERRIGKFELANGGTIFLDEIGEMSPDLQVKLLRVLQEQEIERIGGKGMIKINVRIIAATNRNLEIEMEEGRFRLDLYYRLYVFPILIPPLRERPEDILLLAKHFIQELSDKYNKPAIRFSGQVYKEMLDYRWPGNVRELEHFIERTLLIAKEPLVEKISLPKNLKNSQKTDPDDEQRTKTISENERDYIIAVLEKCKGRIRGAEGAAAVMGLPPTTLHSRMKKLGIKYTDS